MDFPITIFEILVETLYVKQGFPNFFYKAPLKKLKKLWVTLSKN